MERASTVMRPAALGVLVLSAVAVAPAGAASAHVHGHAGLEVAVDGNRLLLDFSSPLDNLIGFEHAPRTDKQKEAVRRMAEQLHKAAQHFVPTAGARCTPGPVVLSSPAIAPSLLGASQSAADKAPAQAVRAKAEQKGHAELRAEMEFRCEQPEKLSSLEVNLFDAFRGLRRIDAQVAGQRKQAAARLTPGSRRVSW